LLPVIRLLTPDQLAWKHPASPNSIGWLLDHISGVEDFWLNEVAFKGKLLIPDDVNERDLAGLIAKHDRIRAQTKELLSGLTEETLKNPVEVPTFPDGWKPLVPPTLGWIFHHAFNHEAYHIGHVVMLLRLQGLPDPLF